MKIAAVLAGMLIGVALLPAVQAKDETLPLGNVKRIYVDQLGGGGESDALRDMIIAALQNSGLFVITENPDRADASLRGSADDKIFMENHNTQDRSACIPRAARETRVRKVESDASASPATGASAWD